MGSKRAKDYQDQYTRPKLRERLKEEIKASDQGGRPGQWSARKSQHLVQAYEAEGGGYRGEKTESQRSLEEWTAQDWQTLEGASEADGGAGMQRYLPAKAWAMLDESERREADRSKIRTDARGRQFADWPEAVQRAMTAAGWTAADPHELPKAALQTYARRLDIRGRSSLDKRALIKALQEAELEAAGDAGGGASKHELYAAAKREGIQGRSKMSKDELRKALDRDAA
jgi:hypothetical protein